MKKFSAVLFDLDGTIAKTMESYFIAWKKACNDFGFEITDSDYYPLEGMEAKELAKTLCGTCGGDESNIEKIVERKKSYFIDTFNDSRADLYPGVEEILSELRARSVPTALVTASVQEQIVASIDAGFLKKFNMIVTGEIGGRGKPYSDPYLKAAELLGIDPVNCVAVENAPLGIKSAKSAGMHCVAVAHTVPKEKLSEADEIFDSISQIKF